MELTDVERLILANQYEILGKLNDSSDYLRLSKQLRDGYGWLYRDTLEHHVRPELSEVDTEFVTSVLRLYEELIVSKIQLDQEKLEGATLDFPGFDGNNEAELMMFALAIRDEGLYEHVMTSKNINSHMPTRSRYASMLNKRKEFGDPMEFKKLNYQQVHEIMGLFLRNSY